MAGKTGPPGGPTGLRRLPQVLIDAPPSGSVPAVEYQWGTHAAALAAEEAAKTQVWKSVRTAIATGLGAFIVVAPQVYADTQPVVFQSVQAGQKPTVPPFIVGQPEQVDLTQQPVVFKPLPGRQGALGEFVYAEPERTDLTQQALISRPGPARQGPVPARTLGRPESVDLTQQALVWSPARTTPGGRVPPYIVGFGEETSYITAYVLEALGGSPPALGAFYTTPSDADLTQQARVWGPARAPAVTSLGAFVQSTQAFVEPNQSIVQRSAPGQQGRTLPPFWVSQQVDPPQILGPVWGPARSVVVTQLGTFVTVAQQQVEDRGTQTFRSTRGQTPTIGQFVLGQPQLDERPQQAVLSAPLPGRQGAVPPLAQSVVPFVDLEQQSVVFPSVMAGTVVPPVVVVEGPFPVGHPVYVKKRPKSALEEFREIFAKIHEQPPVVGFPAKTLKPEIVKPTAPKTLVREVLRDRSVEFAQIREIVKDVQKRREDDDDDDEALLLLS